MAVELEGGCRVVGLKEGAPRLDGDLWIWDHFQSALSLRVLELHGKARFHSDSHDEVLYLLEENEGIHVPAGSEFVLAPDVILSREDGEGSGRWPFPRPDSSPSSRLGMTGLTIISSRTPSESRGPRLEASRVRLDDQAIQKTGDRWYRELIQGETTQFVGSIPPGRAPDHFHLYEEVICILDGSGVMWTGAKSAPVERGSCIFLPSRQPHCLENVGRGELRLLGVFYPAGSPAVRYPA
jgi:mannose-6-phosphate isomerase-like protein (cupin superfamily)